VAFNSPAEMVVDGVATDCGLTAVFSTEAVSVGLTGAAFSAGFCAQAGAIAKNPKIVNVHKPRSMGSPPCSSDYPQQMENGITFIRLLWLRPLMAVWFRPILTIVHANKIPVNLEGLGWV
jgi:hypothetical protein